MYETLKQSKEWMEGMREVAETYSVEGKSLRRRIHTVEQVLADVEMLVPGEASSVLERLDREAHSIQRVRW